MATANAKVKAVLDYLDQKRSQSVPTGMVAYFALSAVPSGWLLCNGANVSRTTYAALFAAIGTRFGAGDGSTTFTLPNLDGRFLEGTTDTSQVGKYVEAGLPNITGSIQNGGISAWWIGSTTGALSVTTERLSYVDGQTFQTVATGLYLDASLSDRTYAGTTVQPKSIRLLPCIKI